MLHINFLHLINKFVHPIQFQNNLLSMNLYGLWERVFQCQTVVHGTAAMMTGLLLAQRKFLFSHKYGGISCCEVTGPRPSLVVLAPAIVYHFANNFLGKLSSLRDRPKSILELKTIFFFNQIVLPY